MAAKGSIVKAELMAKLLEMPGSFSPDGKVVHIDMIENGNPVQIKIALTAVKTAIMNNPNSEIIHEEQFFISDDEQSNLIDTLTEMGVSF